MPSERDKAIAVQLLNEIKAKIGETVAVTRQLLSQLPSSGLLHRALWATLPSRLERQPSPRSQRKMFMTNE
jgi:hypothetical protein